VILWLAGSIACVGLLALVLLFLPLPFNCNAQGRADPSGSWAVAIGFGCGPVALSAIAAAGVKPFLTCHLFGRQLLRLPIAPWLRRKPKPEEAPSRAAPHAPLSRLERSVGRFFRSLDPIEAALYWWERADIFQVRSLIVDLQYSFRDVWLTGRILAALYALSGVLPEHWQINQTPSWTFEDRVALAADGRFRIWPGRLLFDLVRFVLKNWSRVRRDAEPVSE
jgi:hypothetical protein